VEVKGSFHSITNKYFLGLLFVITVLLFIWQNRHINPCYVLINIDYPGIPVCLQEHKWAHYAQFRKPNQIYLPPTSDFLLFRQTVKSQWHKPVPDTSTPFVADKHHSSFRAMHMSKFFFLMNGFLFRKA